LNWYSRKSAVVFTVQYIYAFEPLPFAEFGQPTLRRLHYLVGVQTERYLNYVEDDGPGIPEEE